MNERIKDGQTNKKPSCRQSGPTVPPLFEGQRQTNGGEKKAISQSKHSRIDTRYGDAAISNAIIIASIRYGNSAHVGDGPKQQLCIQNCSQTAAEREREGETWLLLTAYTNSSSLYPTVPSPSPYDIQFSHNTYVADDNRQTDDDR